MRIACSQHYELEFIHPFSDGNGRMGRLWQTLLLMQQYPVFDFLPFETLISKHQKKYYQAISNSDKQGESTIFISFMLKILSKSLDDLLKERTGPITNDDRMRIFLENGVKGFSRKDYMNFHKAISSATASRDLRQAAKEGLIKISGDKNKTTYKIR